jgi:hypothetical protein
MEGRPFDPGAAVPQPCDDRNHWNDLAFACAARAYDHRTRARRGLLLVEDEDVIVYFDTSLPDGSMALRERIAGRFERRLADEGVRVLAQATYPQRGADDGLAMALVLDAGAGDEDEVARAWERAAEGPPDAGG